MKRSSIKAKVGECVECDSYWGPVTGNKTEGYRCPGHYRMLKQRKAMEKQSKAGWDDARKAQLRSSPFCQGRLDGCMGAATEVHHKRGRQGENLTKHLMSVCMNCHRKIEDMPLAQAERLGFKLSRIKPIKDGDTKGTKPAEVADGQAS